MIKEVYDALCREIKKQFPSCKIFEPSVKQGFEKGDFVVMLEELSKSPVPAGLEKYNLIFLIEKHDDVLLDLYESMLNLEKAVALIELDENLLIQGFVTENKIEDEILKMKVSYTFYGLTDEYNEYMGELIYDHE